MTDKQVQTKLEPYQLELLEMMEQMDPRPKMIVPPRHRPINKSLFGLQVEYCDFAWTCARGRYPRSKRKRIRRKWAKRWKRKARPGAFRVGDRFIIHPDLRKLFEAELISKGIV